MPPPVNDAALRTLVPMSDASDIVAKVLLAVSSARPMLEPLQMVEDGLQVHRLNLHQPPAACQFLEL
jgi:hypothetical protein